MSDKNEVKVAVETVKIGFEVNGKQEHIDLGTRTQGDKAGTARERLSGADVIKWLAKYDSDGCSAEEFLAAFRVVSKLGGAMSVEARDEQYDGDFTEILNSLRSTVAPVTKLRSDFSNFVSAKLADKRGWAGSVAMGKSKEVSAAFSGYLYADPAQILAKPVLEQRGKQQVTLKALPKAE